MFAAELPLDADAKGVTVERIERGVTVRYRDRDRDGAEASFAADFVIAATGRAPNVRGLALERTGFAPLAVVFSDPQLAVVGARLEPLQSSCARPRRAPSAASTPARFHARC